MEALRTILIIAAAVALVYAWLIEPNRIKIKELTLTFPNLPPEFDGYTICHLTDLHIKGFGGGEKRLMSLIETREVDACLITGDVTFDPRASDVFRRVCSAVKSRDPIYLVLGNSEHKPWLDTATLVEALSFEGLEILVNSSTEITRGAGKITLVGVDDPYSHHADVQAAFEGVSPDSFIIFMTHCPSTTREGIEKSADLILAGHTHGGQVRFPGLRWFWTHMRSNKMLNDGLYTSDALSSALGIDTGHSVLYVSRGVGTSKFRVRLFCPPEMAWITLRKG